MSAAITLSPAALSGSILIEVPIPTRLRFCISTALESEPLFDLHYLVAAALLGWVERYDEGQIREVRPLPAPSPFNTIVSAEVAASIVERFQRTLGPEVALEAAVVDALWEWVDAYI